MDLELERMTLNLDIEMSLEVFVPFLTVIGSTLGHQVLLRTNKTMVSQTKESVTKYQKEFKNE